MMEEYLGDERATSSMPLDSGMSSYLDWGSSHTNPDRTHFCLFDFGRCQVLGHLLLPQQFSPLLYFTCPSRPRDYGRFYSANDDGGLIDSIERGRLTTTAKKERIHDEASSPSIKSSLLSHQQSWTEYFFSWVATTGPWMILPKPLYLDILCLIILMNELNYIPFLVKSVPGNTPFLKPWSPYSSWCTM